MERDEEDFLGLALLLINILILKAEEERISIYSEIAESENEALNTTEEIAKRRMPISN